MALVDPFISTMYSQTNIVMTAPQGWRVSLPTLLDHTFATCLFPAIVLVCSQCYVSII